VKLRGLLIVVALLAACSSGPRGAVLDPPMCSCVLQDGGVGALHLINSVDCSLTPDEMAERCRQQPSTYFAVDAGCAQPAQCPCTARLAPGSYDCNQ